MEPELSAASVAALHSFRDRAETLKYLQDEDANIGQQEPQAIPNVTNLVQLLVKHRKAGMYWCIAILGWTITSKITVFPGMRRI
jgi:hypothetical protein